MAFLWFEIRSVPFILQERLKSFVTVNILRSDWVWSMLFAQQDVTQSIHMKNGVAVMCEGCQ